MKKTRRKKYVSWEEDDRYIIDSFYLDQDDDSFGIDFDNEEIIPGRGMITQT